MTMGNLSCGMLVRATAVVTMLLSAGAARANVVISAAPTSNMSCSAGVCTATAARAVLNASDLQGMLASSDISVRTGRLAASIVVTVPFSWASFHSLTLDAKHSIIVNKTITDSGAGGLTLTTKNGGNNG